LDAVPHHEAVMNKNDAAITGQNPGAQRECSMHFAMPRLHTRTYLPIVVTKVEAELHRVYAICYKCDVASSDDAVLPQEIMHGARITYALACGTKKKRQSFAVQKSG
jgi:hypothetical protein